jgi:hypothetical protein
MEHAQLLELAVSGTCDLWAQTNLVANSTVAFVDASGLLLMMVEASSKRENEFDLVFNVTAMARAMVYPGGRHGGVEMTVE